VCRGRGEEQYWTSQGECVYLEVLLLGREEALRTVQERGSAPWPVHGRLSVG